MKYIVIDAASGATTNPDGSLKDMNDDQLKAAQKARASQSGIAAKAGGALTMPSKWRGNCPDNNTSWGDWTNYSFPLPDLAHANNAAARLAQNGGYSSEEKAKIEKRIKAAQNRHKASEIHASFDGKIKDMKDKLTSIKAAYASPVKADTGADTQAPDTVTRDECFNMVYDMCMQLASMMQDMYASNMNRTDDVVDGMNEYIASHNEGHMPVMEANQIYSVLKAAGIHKQFDAPVAPLSNPPHQIMCADFSKMKDIKIELK